MIDYTAIFEKQLTEKKTQLLGKVHDLIIYDLIKNVPKLLKQYTRLQQEARWIQKEIFSTN